MNASRPDAAAGNETHEGVPIVTIVPTFRASLDDTDNDDKHWDEKMSHCSFCRHFLLSPCKEQFKSWSRCVDQSRAAGEDFTTVCAEQTRFLMKCTDAHPDYFSSQDDEEAGGSAEETEAEGSTVLDSRDDDSMQTSPVEDSEVYDSSVEHHSEDSSSRNKDMIRRYLSSPCKSQFQQWAQCIDACKNDRSNYHSSCRQLSEALIDCTNVHQEFFQRLDDEHFDE